MTTIQERFLSMAMTINTFLEKNSAKANLLPNFMEFFTQLKNSITVIQTLAVQQEIDIKGVAKVKSDLKNNLIIKAMDIANKIVAYASYSKNQILFNVINYKENELRKCTDTMLKEKCDVIYDIGMQYATEIEFYGVNSGMLKELQSIIANFNTAIPTTRISITEKKQITNQIAVQFDSLSSVLKEIDTIFEIIRYSNVNFYDSFHKARKIVNTGTHYLSLKAIVVDNDTAEPIKNVIMQFILENPKSIIKKKTAEKGGINIDNMPEGTWNVIVTKAGYEAKSLKIVVVDGETSDLVVSLSKYMGSLQN